MYTQLQFTSGRSAACCCCTGHTCRACFGAGQNPPLSPGVKVFLGILGLSGDHRRYHRSSGLLVNGDAFSRAARSGPLPMGAHCSNVLAPEVSGLKAFFGYQVLRRGSSQLHCHHEDGSQTSKPAANLHSLRSTDQYCHSFRVETPCGNNANAAMHWVDIPESMLSQIRSRIAGRVETKPNVPTAHWSSV